MPRDADRWGAASALFALAGLTVLVKLPTRTTPAFWDEMGWLAQSKWLFDFGVTGVVPGLRPDAAFWGHPPGLHALLAVAGSVTGFSVETAHVLIAGLSAVGVCGTFLLARTWYGNGVGWLAALMLLASPMYFAQSGMFLADVPVAALGVLAAYFVVKDRPLPYVFCATAMVLFKETAIAIVVALVIYRFAVQQPLRELLLRRLLLYCTPLLVIGAFFVVQKAATGQFFFIYEFELELFDPSLNMARRRIDRISNWLWLRQGRWVLTLIIVLGLALVPAARRRRELALVVLVVALSGYSFAVLFFLPRYLMPVVPFLCILTAVSLRDLTRVPSVQIAAGTALLTLMVVSFVRQPLEETGEMSMRYRDVVELNRAAAAWIEARPAPVAVVTAFPHTIALTDPLQGYVQRPLLARPFRSEADLTGADVVLVSEPAGDESLPLREAAQRRGWTLAKRLESGPAWIELYVPPR